MQVYVSDEKWDLFVESTGISDNAGDYAFDLATRVIIAAKEFSVERHIEHVLENNNLDVKLAINESMSDIKLSYDSMMSEMGRLFSTTSIESPMYQLFDKIDGLSKKPSKTPIQEGLAFEELIGNMIDNHCMLDSETLEAVGLKTGIKKDSKTGDYVLHMHDGSRVAIEVKKDRSYTLAKILDECKVARQNRDAKSCLFVSYAGSGGANIKTLPISIGENDVIVLFDPESNYGLGYLMAGLLVARSIVSQKTNNNDVSSVIIEDTLTILKNSLDNLAVIDAKSTDIVKLAGNIREQVALNQISIQRSLSILSKLVS